MKKNTGLVLSIMALLFCGSICCRKVTIHNNTNQRVEAQVLCGNDRYRCGNDTPLFYIKASSSVTNNDVVNGEFFITVEPLHKVAADGKTITKESYPKFAVIPYSDHRSNGDLDYYIEQDGADFVVKAEDKAKKAKYPLEKKYDKRLWQGRR